MFDPIDQAFGDLVRRQRIALGLTRAELAHRLGVTVEHIEDIEYGLLKATGWLVLRIARLGLEGPPQAIDALSALVEDFSAIRSPRVRRALLALLQDGGGGGVHGHGAPPATIAAPQEMSRWG